MDLIVRRNIDGEEHKYVMHNPYADEECIESIKKNGKEFFTDIQDAETEYVYFVYQHKKSSGLDFPEEVDKDMNVLLTPYTVLSFHNTQESAMQVINELADIFKDCEETCKTGKLYIKEPGKCISYKLNDDRDEYIMGIYSQALAKID